jgi:outer membrane protein
MSRLMLAILLVVLCMPGFGIAQTSAQPAAAEASTAIPTAKIAWMNMEQAILTCDEGAKLIAEIQKYVDEKNAELDKLRKEADNLRNQLNVQGPKLTDEARADLQDQVDSKELSLQRFQQDTQKDIENRKTRAANYVGNKMQPVIEKISREKGLSAVLFLNQSRDAWVDPSLIITDEIIKSYNQTYPVGAPKTPATAAPAKKP